MRWMIRKLTVSLIVVALVVSLTPAMNNLPATSNGGTAYADSGDVGSNEGDDTSAAPYRILCTAYHYEDGSGADDFMGIDDLASQDIRPGFTFDIAIRGLGYEEGSPYDIYSPLTKDDFTCTQEGTGKVSFTELTNERGYSIKCTESGDITLTFATKDGTWSDSLSLHIKADRKLLPVLTISKKQKESLKTEYDGYGTTIKLWDYKGGMYDPGKKYSKAKDGRVYTISEIKVVSSDESILKVSQLKWNKYSEWDENEMEVGLDIIPVSPGTAYVRFYDVATGERVLSLTVVVTKKTLYNRWEMYLYCDDPDYGETFITLQGNPGDKIKVDYGGKTLNKTMPSNGKLKVTGLPIKKIGTKGSVTFTSSDGRYTATKPFAISDSIRIQLSKVKKSSKKVTATVKYAKKGDIIKLKVGKKTYKKKVTKNKTKFKFTQKIKKQKKGTKITLTVYNKFKQVRAKKTIKVKA